jgi:hypothetical protein
MTTENNTPETTAPEYIAWDTETTRIGVNAVVPELICSSFYDLRTKEADLLHRNPKDEHCMFLGAMFQHHVIGHNIAFDTAVAARAHPSLLPAIWDAYFEGRIHCTMLREMLLNLATQGTIDKAAIPGTDKMMNYALSDLVMQYLGLDITADKEDEDAARLNYDIVMDIPLIQWPDNFVSYAKDDAIYTGRVFLAQEARRQEIMEERGFDPLKVEGFRAMSHFALGLMTQTGNKLDPVEVLRVTDEFQKLYHDPELVSPLIEAGIIEPAVPETPNKRGTREHLPECRGHKENPEYKKSKAVKDCFCPVKMNKAKPEKQSTTTLHDIIWRIAHENPLVEIWASDSLKSKLADEGLTARILEGPRKVRLGEVQKLMETELRSLRSEVAEGEKKESRWQEDLAAQKTETRRLLKSISEQSEEVEECVDPEQLHALADALDILNHSLNDSRDEEKRLNKLLKAQAARAKELASITAEATRERPQGWNICIDKEWLANFSMLHPLLEKYAERKKVEKIVTSYLPKLYWAEGYDQCPDVLEGREGRLDGKIPAKRVHSQFSPLKETGRCSSRAATKGRGSKQVLLYPSWNGQQVDPRVRGCVVPEEGNVLFSIDYNAMELGTAAQIAYNLFGYSVLRDKINAGIDTHAYLGAQIAYALDPYFRGVCATSDPDTIFSYFWQTKGLDEPCDSPFFRAIKGEDATWDDFFKYYRKFAKPTGLGYPGGLGPRTFIAYAKGTYGVTVNLDTATELREIWRNTYPELPEALKYVNNDCADPWAPEDYVEVEDGKYEKRRWYSYTSPLGMRRARCPYTACANGQFLQTPSAEGALKGVCEVMHECTVGPLTGYVKPTIFIHDEIFGEIKEDDMLTDRINTMGEIMVRNMRIITPDVKAGVEPCIMRRWSKFAEPEWETVNGKKVLKVWEPKEEEAE